ncbi:DUF927 domain-containing protein [Aureimonas psammosilenae]|uniref:DUF927 domain-containing protein n=1 Tax=Aureimonas psammosilenae TaxID=2495496 RepID=UPI0012612D52|nr:DUF927 domain-containing protein [Aureimonas psammosilenae]
MTDDTIKKKSILHDERERVWINVFEGPGIEGQPVIFELPREDREVTAVSRAALRNGVSEAALSNLELLRQAINAEAPIVHRAAHTGWRANKRMFVSHRHVAGISDNGTVIPPVCQMIGGQDQMNSCGTLPGWQKVAKVAKYSTTFTVALCAAFAAPLLDLVERGNFALMLYGPSRCGKSSAQLLAASALGFGREEDLPGLGATKAGLLAACLEFHGHMLPINEVGTADGPKREIYVALRNSTYQVMSGQDVIRHPSWPGATSGAPTKFRVICLLSSEKSPGEWADRNGETRDPGEEARLIGLPVLIGSATSIFDKLPSGLEGEALSEWRTRQFARLRDRLPRHRGVAFQHYLDWLLRDVEARTARAKQVIEAFERSMALPDQSEVARDIIAKFGVLAAGGILAVEAGVVPLREKTILRAVRRACRAAVTDLSNPDAQLQTDLSSLRERLDGGSLLDADNLSKKGERLIGRADGFYRQRGDGRQFVIRAQIFMTWFTGPSRGRQLLEWLANAGFLEHNREPKGSRRSNEWAQTQTVWPDDTRPRSICIFLPNGLADLE